MNLIRLLLISGLTFLVGSLPASVTIQQVSQSPSTVAASNQDVSRNWSGYAATSGTYTGVSATWIVPQVDGNNNYGIDATWVGIGGVHNRDLIQAGTQGFVDRSGGVSYQTFFETLPDVAQQLPLDVKAGDSVSVSLQQQQPGQWLISLKNNTSGQNYQMTQNYDSSLSSAEWIEEAPSGLRRILPLDNFGTVQFSNASAIKDDKTVTIAETNAQPITMADDINILAKPSGLNNDGAGFSINRTDSPSTTSVSRRYYRFPLRRFVYGF
jgi:hypothetical protein